MMKRTLLLLFAVLLLSAPDAAQARFDRGDAVNVCMENMRRHHGATDFHRLTVNRRGDNDFIVTGIAERRHRGDLSFVCTIENGKVRKLTASERGGRRSFDSDDHYDADSWRRHRPRRDDSYSPRDGIICFHRQRACYRTDGSYSERWTRREFY